MQDILGEVVNDFQTPFTDSVLIFSLILFIILLAPILLRRLRVPGIIGLILSGVVIGPHGFHLIEHSSAVDLFSTIGLLYIMFIAGLELDMVEFRKNRHRSIVFGILTFSLPIGIGFPILHYVYGYSLESSLLAASMFATQTMIAYPIVSRLGISKTSTVAIAVGGTIFTDTAVLILLAAITGTRTEVGPHFMWLRLLISLAVFVAIVWFAIPRLSSWFFKRLEDEKHAHFIYVLAVVFFTAFLAKLAGLEPIIGAFAAGLTLNRLVPHTSPLMNRIEFVGSSLFIPFFLISVGMLIDLQALTTSPMAILMAVTFILISQAGKWTAAQLTGLIFKFNPLQRKLIYGLSTAHAAATLAIILVGYRIGIIDITILNGTIVLILVSCLLSSLVTDNVGRKVALQQEDEDGASAKTTSQNILVPISNPTTMERLIDFAMTIKDPKDHSPLVALAVVDDDAKVQSRLIQARKMLEKAITHAASADQVIEIATTIDQNVINGIKRVAKEKFTTDIIMGWPAKSNITDFIFGKTFDRVVNQTHQAVYLTRFVLPLNLHTNVHLLCPEFTEREPGFEKWVSDVLLLAKHLNLPLSLHAPGNTQLAFESFAKKKKSTVTIRRFSDQAIGNLALIKTFLKPTDILITATSRVGGFSYTSGLEAFPRKLVRVFEENSLIFIYPEIEPVDSFQFAQPVQFE